MSHAYRTVMVGFGSIAYGYSSNADFVKEFPIPTHYAAINEQKRLFVDTVVDVDPAAIRFAQNSLDITYGSSNVADVPDKNSVEIVVLTCPPEVDKVSILKVFPNLKGVIIEKPLGVDLESSRDLALFVKDRKIHAQVSYLRRADEFLIGLLNGGLINLIGSPLKAEITYGNGFRNNGSHLVDLVRMLLGEIVEVPFARPSNIKGVVLKGDQNIITAFRLNSGIDVTMQPIDFNYYRENSLDIWGNEGRLVLTQEGSYYQYWRAKKSRFGEIFKNEIDWAHPNKIGQTCLGVSLGRMYSNLLDTIQGSETLCSPLGSAVVTETIIMKICETAAKADATLK